MLCLSGFELYSRWVPLFAGLLKRSLMEPSLLSYFKTPSISLTLGIEPDLPFCSSNRAIPATVVLIPVISGCQLAILLF